MEPDPPNTQKGKITINKVNILLFIDKIYRE
jgi:hypothetical protein